MASSGASTWSWPISWTSSSRNSWPPRRASSWFRRCGVTGSGNVIELVAPPLRLFALVALGYKPNEVNKLLGKLDIEGLSAEDIIRRALKQVAA